MLTDPDDSKAQAQCDARRETYPHCCACGRSVYDWDTYHVVADEFVFCENCYDHEERRTEEGE